MSLAARPSIVLCAGLCGVALFACGLEAASDRHGLFYLFGACCLGVALACFARGRASRKPIRERVSVHFDDVQVRTRAAAGVDSRWNQAFAWSDVTRVCFRDQGLTDSDLLLIEVRDRAEPIAVPTEAAGGSEFFGALVERNLFPDDVWRQAVAETSGRTHCWPPHDERPSVPA